MAAQKGLAMTIEVSSDGTSGGALTAVAGLRTKSFALNADSVDITSASSTGHWRELLSGAGVISMSVSGSGVFLDTDPDEDVRGHIMAGTSAYLRMTMPDFGTFVGNFHVGSVSYAGEHDGEATYDMSFESAGEITWSAA
jgi:TP901-1 family phage major tail protein